MRASVAALVALVGAAAAADLRRGVPGIIRRVDDERAVGEADFLEFEEELKSLGHYEFLQVGEGADPNQAQPQDLAPRNMECYCKFVKQKVEVAPASAYNNMDPSQGKADGFKETSVQLADRQEPAAEEAAAEPRFAAKTADLVPRADAAEQDAPEEPARRVRVVRRRPEAEEADAEPRFAERRASLYEVRDEERYADPLEEAEADRLPLRRHRRYRRRAAAAEDPYLSAPETDLIEEGEEDAVDASDDDIEREIEAEQEEEREYRLRLLRQRKAHKLRLARIRQRLGARPLDDYAY